MQRNPRAPAVARRYESLAGIVERRAVLEFAEWRLRDEVECVDLSMRMGDRGAHLRAAVLEHEHVGDVLSAAEALASLGPEIDDLAHPVHAERPERRIVVGGVEDHLTPSVRHRRPAVRDPAHVVLLCRLQTTGTERARGFRKVRSRLPRGDDVRLRRPSTSSVRSAGDGRAALRLGAWSHDLGCARRPAGVELCTGATMLLDRAPRGRHEPRSSVQDP